MALTTSPKVEVPEGGSYGYGWRLDDGGFGHSGCDGRDAWIDPELELVVLLTQTPRRCPPRFEIGRSDAR